MIVDTDKLTEIFNLVVNVKNGMEISPDRQILQDACDKLKKIISDDPEYPLSLNDPLHIRNLDKERIICSSCGQYIDPYFHTCPGLNNYFFESTYKE